jgi:opacity protein-like surface antigen
MSRFASRLLAGALLACAAGPALAADPYIPPPVEETPVVAAPAYSGWYLRGDLDYHWTDFRGATYDLPYAYDGSYGQFDNGDIDGSWSLGAGVGYQFNQYLRTDVTLDYLFDADFTGSTTGICTGGYICTSTDTTSYNAWLLLANAYVDLGTWYGITPYVGAGLGGAYVNWDTLTNTDDDGTFYHEGNSDWRFAWAAMVGASYCLTSNLKLDVGYRYSQVDGGTMFGYAYGAGPGYDDGFNINEVRAGLRYQFGGGAPECAPPVIVPEPVYK